MKIASPMKNALCSKLYPHRTYTIAGNDSEATFTAFIVSIFWFRLNAGKIISKGVMAPESFSSTSNKSSPGNA